MKNENERRRKRQFATKSSTITTKPNSNTAVKKPIKFSDEAYKHKLETVL